MSLDAIRDLRRGRRKPGLVMVVIGNQPSCPVDDTAIVVVRPGDQPQFMDWRPLIGVLVAVFTIAPRPDLTLTVLQQLEAAGAKLFGAADQSGVHPLLVDSTERHEELLRKAWRLLCQ